MWSLFPSQVKLVFSWQVWFEAKKLPLRLGWSVFWEERLWTQNCFRTIFPLSVPRKERRTKQTSLGSRAETVGQAPPGSSRPEYFPIPEAQPLYCPSVLWDISMLFFISVYISLSWFLLFATKIVVTETSRLKVRVFPILVRWDKSVMWRCQYFVAMKSF